MADDSGLSITKMFQSDSIGNKQELTPVGWGFITSSTDLMNAIERDLGAFGRDGGDYQLSRAYSSGFARSP